MTAKKAKRKMTALSILLVLALALGTFVCVWFFGKHYPVFDKVAKREQDLPNLSDGFCPQGMCDLAPNDGGYTMAVSGYYKAGVPSRVYLLGAETPAYVTVEKDGKALDSHFGGVAATQQYLYITADSEIVRVALGDVFAAAQTGGKVAIVDSFETGVRQNAFCSISGDMFFAGEFYRKGNYETDEASHITRGDETNPALVYCYKMNEDNPCGMESTTSPYAILSVRGLVQGIAVTGEHVVLSCSWGLADSKLYCYSNPLGGATDLELDGVPVYFLGNDNLLGTLTAPCMSEGIFEKNGRIVILFESCTNKYKQFVRRQTNGIYSVSLEDIIK